MPGTYSQLLLHIVFATKHRQPWLTKDVATRLYPYIGGIIRGQKGTLYDIGGVEDHVHLYMQWRTDASIAEIVRYIKGVSSKWLHETYPALDQFAWQNGYSVFTVSKSQEAAIRRYLACQESHHHKEDYKTELLKLLKAHGVEFDEKYVFD